MVARAVGARHTETELAAWPAHQLDMPHLAQKRGTTLSVLARLCDAVCAVLGAHRTVTPPNI